MNRTFGIVFIIFCIAGSARSQKLLILERPGTTKHHIFKTGSSIRLYDGKSKRMLHGNINRITDTSFTVNYQQIVVPAKVIAVYRPLTLLQRKFTRPAITAGLGYFLLTGINNAINKESPIIDHGTLVASAIVTSAGIATSFLRYRKFKIGHSWRLKIIDLDFPSEQK